MNKWIGKGRTTSALELRQTQSGKSVVRFTLACDGLKDKNGEKRSNFIPCTAWGQTAETMAKYVQKGQEVLIEGMLMSGSYQDKNHSDVTHYTLDCMVEHFEFCGTKSQNATSPAQGIVNQAQAAGIETGNLNDYEVISDGTVPF